MVLFCFAAICPAASRSRKTAVEPVGPPPAKPRLRRGIRQPGSRNSALGGDTDAGRYVGSGLVFNCSLQTLDGTTGSWRTIADTSRPEPGAREEHVGVAKDGKLEVCRYILPGAVANKLGLLSESGFVSPGRGHRARVALGAVCCRMSEDWASLPRLPVPVVERPSIVWAGMPPSLRSGDAGSGRRTASPAGSPAAVAALLLVLARFGAQRRGDAGSPGASPPSPFALRRARRELPAERRPGCPPRPFC